MMKNSWMVSDGGLAWRTLALCGLMVMMSGLALAESGGYPAGENSYRVDDLPEGALKSQIQQLAPKAQARALSKLQTMNFSALDATKNLNVTEAGDVYYACYMGHDGCAGAGSHDMGNEADEESVLLDRSMVAKESEQDADLTQVERSAPVGLAPIPSSSQPPYNSLPGAEYHIYLDFNGGIITGTAWNSQQNPSFDCFAYDLDGDPTTFSEEEQESIRRIWERVSEDFSPFAVNVTTDVVYDPENNFYPGDRSKIIGAMFTQHKDVNDVSLPHDGRGGVAFSGVVGSPEFQSKQPVWIQNYEATRAAEVGSHEVGHMLGLSHDGNGTSVGDGSTGFGGSSEVPSWGLIMGVVSPGSVVTQWSKGEYKDSSNPQDDLAIIASQIPLRADDHGGTFSLATPLAASSTVDQEGIVERTGDIDVFRFEAGAGQLDLEVVPYRDASSGNGGNLDVLLEIYDSNGQLVIFDNPLDRTDARVTTTLTAGTYYAMLKPTGAGNPLGPSLPSGYTEYGSLGQYTLKGSYPVAPALLEVLTPAVDEPVVAGSTYDITWEPSGISGNVKLELYLGGESLSVISTNEVNDGSFSWTVSAGLTIGSGYAVRVSSEADPLIASLGELFTITGQAASPLANALDAPELDWSTTGSTPGSTPSLWFSQTSETFDGIDAAESGFIPNGFYFPEATTSLTTTVQGPGTLTFRWKVDSRAGVHKLGFYMNNVVQQEISGTTNWSLRTFAVPAGTQTLRWTYSKNFVAGTGQDRGWVDQVSFVADGDQALVVEQPSGTALTSGSSTIDFGAVAMGATSSAKTFTLRNDGIGDLSDISVAVMGEHGADFTAGALATTSLAPGASTTVDVSFSPSEAFERNAYLAIFSSDFGNSPFIVKLTGDTPDVGLLEVQEVGNVFFSGELGSGNFSPLSRVYSLRNTGQQTLNWEVTSTATWITLPTTSGTLGPNQLALVAIEVNQANASALTEYGDYSGTLHFTNTGDGRGDTVRYAFLSITKEDQVITFDEIPGPVATDDGAINLIASSSSGLPISFSSSDPNVATVAGNTLTIVGEGSVVITAAQEGDGQFAAATPVERELAVLLAGQPPAIVYEPFDDGEPSLVGNAAGEGLAGVWSGSASVSTGSLNFGSLTAGRGNRILLDNLNAHVNTGTALGDSGLLADGETLWFSVVVETGNVFDRFFGELGFAFGSEHINPGSGLPIVNSGQALGFTFYRNRLRAVNRTPGLVRSSDVRTFVGDLSSYLVVGKIVWGSNRENIEIYLPSSRLVLGEPVSKHQTSGNLDQATFDTMSFASLASNSPHQIDEIRFGATYESVVDFRVLNETVEVFQITGLPSQSTVGDPISGITITALNGAGEVATSFDGTVSYGGSAGVTGTSPAFVDGVLSGVEITPVNLGAGLTFTVDSGEGQTGSASWDVVSRYDGWANGTFAKPFTETDPSANPDQDQFNNLQEYAFGTDPTSSVMNQLSYVVGGEVVAGAPVIEKTGSGVEAVDFSIVFTRRKDFATSGITYSARFSADLQAWEEHSVITSVVASSDPDYEVVKITFPSSVPLQSGGSAPTRFARIGVE